MPETLNPFEPNRSTVCTAIRYFSLDEAREEIRRRWADAVLRTSVEEWLGDRMLHDWSKRDWLGIGKRLLDTMLAATFQQAGVKRMINNNEGDFNGFGCFEIVTFLT